MKIIFHNNFEKQYKKLKKNQQDKFKERIAIFREDPFASLLGNHPLKGRYTGYRSISISGDLRAIYKTLSHDIFLFVTIDKHSKLYSS
ncbi:MAG: type II toxin-antitoxin system mRNA interferase toxin, RelE/StbE family [Parcubacteria group bacterium]|nr:type II toxin-antitoxin system mRNA interferase toxin, RelE/StbE family [Parcubacteria group bacterium]